MLKCLLSIAEFYLIIAVIYEFKISIECMTA